jgi:hypothetical protein
MALSLNRKSELAALRASGALEADAVRRIVDRFLAVSGYTDGDLADAAGVGRVALNHFRHGRYGLGNVSDSSELNVCAKLKDYCEPRLAAFTSGAVIGGRSGSGAVYRTGNYQLVRKAVFSAVNHGWTYCIDGAPGTRKTFLLRAAIAEIELADAAKNGHGRRVFFVRVRRKASPQGLLQSICLACGIPIRGTIDQLLRKIQFHFADRKMALVFDESQRMSEDCIEIVRDLLDLPPYIGMVFAGSHDIQRVFRSLDMEQWRSRVQKTVELTVGVTREEVAEIMRAELGEQPSKKELDGLIAGFRVKDVRRGHDLNCSCDGCTYISARELFFFIEQIKVRGHQAQGATAC